MCLCNGVHTTGGRVSKTRPYQRAGQMLPGPYTTRQVTYDLRRLSRKGLLRRLHKNTATN